MTTLTKALLLLGQIAVLAVVGWAFAPGPPARTPLGHPVAALDWTPPPPQEGFEAAPLDDDIPGVRLTQGANQTFPKLSPQRLEGAFTISIELQIDKPSNRALRLLSRWEKRDGGRSFILGIRKGQRPFLVVSGNGRKDREEYREIRAKRGIPLGKPVYLVATFSPDERMALFVDGKLVAQIEGEARVPSGAFPSRSPILLGSDTKGARWTSGTFSDLPGIYGPVTIYDRAIPDAEIAAAAAALGYPR